MTTPFLAMLNTPEIIALLVLALVLFGAKKLPELARGLGQGIKEFKKATRDVTDELHNAVESEPPRPAPAPYSEPTTSSYGEPSPGVAELPQDTATTTVEPPPSASPAEEPPVAESTSPTGKSM
jgi:sec-independent protein translocase protein TatA